jgi:regulator of protease activity HflC (stomatin/prohibitin superfamily)
MRITVQQGFAAVVRRDGVVHAVHGPGRHRLPRPAWRRRVELVDLRLAVLAVTGQEVATADVPGAKVSAHARWRVGDPVAFVDRAQDPVEQLRLAVQLALRDWAASVPLEVAVADRSGATPALTASVRAAVQQVGIEVEEVAVRDVVVPGEVRRAVLALATARQEGQVALERARSETAALRALANGARVLADHPDLARLRLAQAAGESGGTVVVTLAQG